jgi:hypothetical protein
LESLVPERETVFPRLEDLLPDIEKVFPDLESLHPEGQHPRLKRISTSKQIFDRRTGWKGFIKKDVAVV